MWNLINKMNEQTKLKQTHRYREQTGGCQRGGGLGDWVKTVRRLRVQIGSYKTVTGM